MKAKKIMIKMLGSYDKYESGIEIEVSEEEAVRLISLGYAFKIEAPVAQAEE